MVWIVDIYLCLLSTAEIRESRREVLTRCYR